MNEIKLGQLLDLGLQSGYMQTRIQSSGTGNTLIREYIPSRHYKYRDLIVRGWKIELYVDNGKYSDRSFAKCRLVVCVFDDDFNNIKNKG